MTFSVGESVKSFCNVCGCRTWHAVLHSVVQEIGDEDGWERNTDLTIQCGGCRNVKLRNDWTGPGMFGESTTTDFPPAALRKPPNWMSRWFGPPGLKEPVRMICDEVYKALQNDMPHLAAMGVRAALEQAMIDKIGGDRRGFDENLKELYQQGHVSLLMQKQLESVLDAGHATIHRGHTPSEEDLNILVGVMEHVIESLYVHEDAVKRMAERIPPRPSRPSKTKAKPAETPATPEAT